MVKGSHTNGICVFKGWSSICRGSAPSSWATADLGDGVLFALLGGVFGLDMVVLCATVGGFALSSASSESTMGRSCVQGHQIAGRNS